MKLKQLPIITSGMVLLLLLLFPAATFSDAQNLETSQYEWGPFDQSYNNTFTVIKPAMISNDALQITPVYSGNWTLPNRSGRIFFNQSFTLWTDSDSPGSATTGASGRLASFNTSFLVNVNRVNGNPVPGEGLAFLIAPDLTCPQGSDGQYLGLTNAASDGNPSNHLLAVELDTFKQSFDPDDNHLGLNINSILSNKTVSLSNLDIQIAPNTTKFYMVWVQYDGVSRQLDVFMAEQSGDPRKSPFFIMPRPTIPILTANLSLKDIVERKSYFGFSASTGSETQLNCVLRWNLTVEKLTDVGSEDSKSQGLKIGLGVGVPLVVLLLLGLGGLVYYVHKRRRAAASDPNILGALKRLPGTPREFEFKELKKATNNFDEKHKLGQGGFGVVYRGVLPKENLEVAVKKFSRDNLKGKDDFLAELTIINRLRHKHLVRLLGARHVVSFSGSYREGTTIAAD